VNQLMGPDLWRIYSLLAGDVDSILADALDWRTAFGMYLWYHPHSGSTDGTQHTVLHSTVQKYEKAVEGTCFCPIPRNSSVSSVPGSVNNLSYLSDVSGAASEPRDLQFNIVRVAASLSTSSEVSNFDYNSHSDNPLEVAYSWHVSVMLLTLCKGDLSTIAFQRLTQQYCLILELLGYLEWAVYVALFIVDARCRAFAVQHLLQSNCSCACTSIRESAYPKQWAGVPMSWWLRASALQSEIAWEWPAAILHWQRCEEVQRCIVILVGYLQKPALLRHAVTPLHSNSDHIQYLAKMAPPTRWLLLLLEDLEPLMSGFDGSLKALARECLQLMQEWFKAGSFKSEPTQIAQLCWRCEKLRRYTLGLPW